MLVLALAVVAVSVMSGPSLAAPTHATTPAHALGATTSFAHLSGGGPLPVLIASVSGGPDTLDTFAMLANNIVPQEIYGTGWNNGFATGWEDVGAADAGTSPSIVTWGQNSLTIFAERQSQLEQDTGAGNFPYWSNSWSALPLPGATFLNSGPGATSWGGQRLDVFAWAAKRFGRYLIWAGLLHEWSNDGGANWQYETLPSFAGYAYTRAPMVVSRGANDLTVLAFGTNDSLSALTWNGSSWGGWQSLGGYLPYQQVSAVPLAGSQVQVFGVGGNGAVYDNTLTGATWSGWNSLGGYLTSSPTAASWTYDSLTVCALGGDSALWCKDDIYGSWSGWYSLGGYFVGTITCDNCSNVASSGPVSAVPDQGTLDMFAESSDLTIWRQEGAWDVYSGWSWGGWASAILRPA